MLRALILVLVAAATFAADEKPEPTQPVGAPVKATK
jgi:hypothetical protein